MFSGGGKYGSKCLRAFICQRCVSFVPFAVIKIPTVYMAKALKGIIVDYSNSLSVRKIRLTKLKTLF